MDVWLCPIHVDADYVDKTGYTSVYNIPCFLSKMITYNFVNDCSSVLSVENEHDKPSKEYIIEHIINHVRKLLH